MFNVKFKNQICGIVFSTNEMLSIKKSKHIYGIRHSDNDWEKPSTVEKFVVVNRWGFLVCDKPLKELNKKNDYINLTKKETDRFISAGEEN